VDRVARALRAWLFPEPPREFPGRRFLKIVLRAIHVLFAGVLVGAYAFSVESRGTWLAGTIASGVLLLLLDLHESGAFLLQVRGLVVVLKIGLVAALPWLDPWQPWALGFLVVLSVLSSHAPARIRYRVVVGSRVRGAETRG